MNKTQNHVRQAMKLLGYTNQSLADELSDARLDGQRTSPATISRWMSGSLPMEPALVLYLKERLAHKYYESFSPRLRRTQKIAIGGGKGGSGSTTIALALSVLVRELGYRVALQTAGDACNSQYIISENTNTLKVAEKAEDLASDVYDFMFFDIPSRAFTEPEHWEHIIDSISGYDLGFRLINQSQKATIEAR